MQKRVFGLEREHNFHPLKVFEDKKRSSLVQDAVVRLMPHSRNGTLMSPYFSEFIANGGRYYWDTGFHFETSTPECGTVRDLVIWDKAGERILEDVVAVLNTGNFLQHKPDFRAEVARLGGCSFFKNNTARSVDPNRFQTIRNNVSLARYVSCGSHLNLLWNIIESGCESRDVRMVLAPFLFTSYWLSGSGMAYERNDGSMAYGLSQRALFTDCFNSIQAASSNSLKPMFLNRLEREENLADSQKYRRLQIVGLDSSLCEWQTYVPAVILGIVLRMIEDHAIRIADYGDPDYFQREKELLRAQRGIMWFGAERSRFLFRGETETVASLHRKYYLDPILAYKASGVLWSDEEEDGLQKYGFLIDAFDRASSSFELAEILAPYIGWAAKMHYILLPAFERLGYSLERANTSDAPFEIVLRNGNMDSKNAQAKIELLDARFHDVRRDVGLYYSLEKKGLIERIVFEEEITRAKEHAPLGTRAEARDKRIMQLRSQGKKIMGISWTDIQHKEIDNREILERSLEPCDADPASFRLCDDI